MNRQDMKVLAFFFGLNFQAAFLLFLGHKLIVYLNESGSQKGILNIKWDYWIYGLVFLVLIKSIYVFLKFYKSQS